MIKLLLLLFGMYAVELDHPRYAVRERAESVLYRFWPLTEPALATADRGSSLEAQIRAERIRERLPASKRMFAVYVQPWTRLELDALDTIMERHEFEGLPWGSQESHGKGSSSGFLKSLSVVRHRLSLLNNYVCEFEIRSWIWTGKVVGLDDLRFAVRGLPIPTDIHCSSDSNLTFATVACQWHEIKQSGYWRDK